MTPVLSRVSRKWAIGSAPLDIVNARNSDTAPSPLLKSILSLGTFFGALAAAPIADGLGRRLGIIVSCLVFSAGVAMQAAATTTPLFVVGRVGAGLGVGLVSCMVPMYQVRLCLQMKRL